MSYHRPETVDEALSILTRGGVSVVAGGTDWFPSRGQATYGGAMLDVTGIAGLRGVTPGPEGWRIGAATTWTDIARADLPAAFDGLRAAAREVGGVQVQNAGTVAGNLCNASPAADGVPPLLVLDAEVELAGPGGVRRLALVDFLTGARQTSLAADELVLAVHVPDPPAGARGGFVKLGARKHLVISIAMVAVLVVLRDGCFAEARVAVGACSAVARRLSGLEAALKGLPVDDLNRVIRPDQFADLAPIDDIRGSAAYRLDAVAALCRDALTRAGKAA